MDQFGGAKWGAGGKGWGKCRGAGWWNKKKSKVGVMLSGNVGYVAYMDRFRGARAET